jgi:thioredoxin reductase (NADPH)
MENVIIIGSGPAGLTAAIYAARANLKPLLIEGVIAGGQTGGQLMITTEVENFPGFPKGIKGPELVELLRAQAERFGTRFVLADVEKAHLTQGSPFKLEADGQVFACATCDGYFFRDQDVCVVGGGDTALEEALYLAGLCKSVTLIHRREELRASKIMQDRAKKHPKIKFLWNTVVEEVHDVSQGTVTGLTIKNLKTNETSLYPTQGLFIAIGHVPNTQLFKGQITLDENGYILTKKGTASTNIEGVFASGDVQDHVYRQAITAAGTGCMAAIEAERWMGEKGLL